MRPIKFISIHCSDSQNPNHDNIKTIRNWHTLAKPYGNGWTDIGYHFFVRGNGTIEIGKPLNEIPFAVLGHNKDMVAICLHGKETDKFTPEQFESAARICIMVMKMFNVPLSNILPHNHWDKGKTCPNFDIKKITDKIAELLE